MEELKKRKKIVIGFLIFLAFMFLCTMVSKGIYTSGLPQITVEKPVSQSLPHRVSVEGTIREGSIRAVNALSGLRVDRILVREGEKVSVEDALFRIDMEDLEEQILKQERDIKKLNLQIGDLKSNKQRALEQKEEEKLRAEQDYSSTEGMTDVQIARAQEDMGKAAQELDQHKNNGVPMTSQEERNNRQAEYDNWSNQKKDLTVQRINLETEKKRAEDAQVQAKTMLEEGVASGLPQEEIDVLTEAVVKAEADLGNATQLLEETVNALLILESSPVTKPDFSSEDMKKADWENKKKQLEEDLSNAGRTSEDAVQTEKKELTEAERKVQDAGETGNIDSTIEIYGITLAEKEELLKKYKEVREAEGNIYGDCEGMVTTILVQEGERTMDGAVVRVADLAESFEFHTTLTKEQKKYVNQGEAANLDLGGNNKVDIRVDFVKESENAPGIFDLTVFLPKETGNIGQNAIFTQTVQSESYGLIIPLNAVYTDDNGRKFVYILSEKEGFLGSELSIAAIQVNVLDQNEKSAAIEEGIITGDTEIVITATKELKDGAVVRFVEAD